MRTAVRPDLNNIEFQSALFDLQKPEQPAVLATLRIHPDHDSAYK